MPISDRRTRFFANSALLMPLHVATPFLFRSQAWRAAAPIVLDLR